MKFLNACVITKPGFNREVKRRTENLLRSLGCRLLGNPRGADLCIVIGGDGALLYHQSGIRAPILGIRTPGHVGYYLKATQGDFGKKLRALLKGRCFVHKLPRLEALINGKRLKTLALNEVLISPIYCRRILESRVSFRGKKSLERNSGLVIYTPSGSHAFAKSLGARKSRFGIIPIAPFSGKIKKDLPLGRPLKLEMLSREAELCIDGQESQVIRLKRGDRIEVRKSKDPALIVAFSRRF